jgi:adenylate cyclase
MALRFRRSWRVMLLIAAFATGIGWLWWSFDVLGITGDELNSYDSGLEKFTNKAWFPWGRSTRADDIVIVAIDDKTFIDIKTFAPWRTRYGSWPYDRVLWADVFEYLKAAGAKEIIFDATLDEPKSDITGDLALGQTVTEQGIPLYLGFNVIPKVDPLPKVEAVNAPPISAHAAVTAEADAGATEVADDAFDDPKPEDEAAKAARLAKVAQVFAFPVETRGGLELQTLPGVAITNEHGVETGTMPTFPVPPIDQLVDAVSGWGLVLLEADDDGKMRRTSFAYTDGTNTYVTLPVAAAADALGADKLIIEPGRLTLGSKQWKIDPDGTAWLDYGGTVAQRYASISLVDVLRARKASADAKAAGETAAIDAKFKGKYVFVAGFALGTSDVKATPLEHSAPGVAKQLAAFEGLVHRGFITTAPMWVVLLFTFIVCLFSTSLVLVIRNVFVDIGWPVLLYTSFFFLTGSVLAVTKVHLLSAMPGFAATIASVISTVYERLFADKQRDLMKTQFAAYMESDLVERMVEGRELPKLEGESMEITAFFSDIKGFSTFSEKFREDPKGLMKLLNRYLSTVTPVLTAQGACIDKYIGDAVVALFGAPIRYPDHALRACRGALAVQVALTALRAELQAEGLPDVYTRIGLNTDTMLVGNIGSAQLIDYTAIGDGMNLAARLEGANKQFGSLILMGENTYLAVKDQVIAREVDVVRVAGKHLPTRIYELVGLVAPEGGAGVVSPTKLEVLAGYQQALVRYRALDFAGAKALLGSVALLDPADGPSNTLLHRCEKFMVTPPPAGWDGVTELEK